MRIAALVFLALVSASILASAATTLTIEYSAEPRGLRGARHTARLYDLVAVVYTDNPACVRHVVEAALRGEAELFPPPYTIFREQYLSAAEGLGRGECRVDKVHFYAYPNLRPGDAAYAAEFAAKLFNAPVVNESALPGADLAGTWFIVYYSVPIPNPYASFYIRYYPLYYVLAAHGQEYLWPQILAGNETLINEVAAMMPSLGFIPLTIRSYEIGVGEEYPMGLFIKEYFARIDAPRHGGVFEWGWPRSIPFYGTGTLTSFLLRALPDIDDYYYRFILDYNVTVESCWNGGGCGAPEVIVNDPILGSGIVNAVYHVELRDQCRWSDGSPVTARDIAAHVVLATRLDLPPREYAGAGAYLFREYLVGYTIIDDRHIDLYFSFNLPGAERLYERHLSIALMPIFDPAVEYAAVYLTGRPELPLNMTADEIIGALDKALASVDARWRPDTKRILRYYSETGSILLVSGAWRPVLVSGDRLVLEYTGRPADMILVHEPPAPAETGGGWWSAPALMGLLGFAAGAATAVAVAWLAARRRKR